MKKISYRCIEDAKNGKRIEPVLVSILMAVLFLFIPVLVPFFGIKVLASMNLFTNEIVENTVFAFLDLSLIFASILISIFLWVKYYQGRKIATIGFYKDGWLKNYAKGALIGIIMFSLVMAVLYVTGNAHIDTNPTIITGTSSIWIILILAPGWMIQSATEEALTRGWLLSSIGSKTGIFVAVIISSVFFGAIHLGNNGVTVLAIVNLILIGAALAVMSIYYNNIWVASGIHFTWNMIQGNIYGVPVSGTVYGNASIIQTSLGKNELFTGGNFGPEAGIVSTVVLSGIGIIYLVLLLKRENNK